MIYAITGGQLPPWRKTECSTRLHSLWAAYGDVPFLRFYRDEAGNCLGVLDGGGVLDALDEPTEEWAAFLRLCPELCRLHTDDFTGKWLEKALAATGTSGKLMRFTGKIDPADASPAGAISLPAVYALYRDCFPAMPPFEVWYVDVSHRVRHGAGRVVGIENDKRAVSAAMTVAEFSGAAVVGPVATAPERRGEGLATVCLRALLGALSDFDAVWIVPDSEKAKRLYTRLGFAVCGGWSELEL